MTGDRAEAQEADVRAWQRSQSTSPSSTDRVNLKARTS
jgi:hypothetical protein